MRKLPTRQLSDIILRICNVFCVVENTRDQILRSLQSGFNDFEDGLQYQCALDAHCDCIITRNQKDFIDSSIPVMTAGEFITTVHK